jgi:hypothetical protein
LRIVGSDVKDVVGLILNTGNVDRHQILGDLLPSNRSSAAGAHVEHFSPQPKSPNIPERKKKKNHEFKITSFKKINQNEKNEMK